MPTVFGTPEHWHRRAAQDARDTAKGIKDADTRRAMLQIAENYDKIAKRAEARAVGISMRPPSGLTGDADA
jgi:hypothetical protein